MFVCLQADGDGSNAAGGSVITPKRSTASRISQAFSSFGSLFSRKPTNSAKPK
jgi:hypothetical protein